MTDRNHTTDSLDRLAAEIRDQRLDDARVDAATERVWARLQAEHAVDAPLRSCADVQRLLPAYVTGELGAARALLVGDHTRGCVPCRRVLLELKAGDSRPVTPDGDTATTLRMPRWLKAAAAVVLLAGGGAVAFNSAANLAAERRLTASVASANGALQLVAEETTSDLDAGDIVRARQRLRTAKDAGAMLRLADGSTVEMAPRSELRLRGSRRGTTIELGRGNIIVHAADQGRDRLAVVTQECQVAVKGTIFAVNHGLKGSRVSVIEGEVEVRYGDTRNLLLPGEQVTTDERLRPVAVADEIAWSVNADEHLALLRELTRLQHEVSDAVDIAAPRTSTRLLDLAPADTAIYVAMPDITDGLGAARRIFSSRLADSQVLRDWWQREIVAKGIDTEIETSLDRLQFFGDAVGDEVVVVVPATALRSPGAPLILAGLDDPAAFRNLIEGELAKRTGGPAPVQLLDDPWAPAAPGAELLIWLHDDLVVAAADAARIQWVASRIDGGAPSPFTDSDLHRRLAERYAGGVEWLLGVDLGRTFAEASVDGATAETAMLERMGLLDATTLVFERHRGAAGSAVDAEVRFRGHRRGVAAWLADPAPLASLEFVSTDATVVTAVAAKDGIELFDELIAMVADMGPDALAELEAFESELGIDLRNDLAAAIGGEGTFALDGPVLPLPTWKLIVEVYDPATLEHALAEVLARANAELAANGAAAITVRVDESGGRRFTSVSHPASPVAFTYTMGDGFMVAGSSRAAVEQSIAVRDSGMGLARSAVFRELLPDNGFTDCSALVYRNLSPILGVLPTSALGGELAAYEELLRDSAEPGLFCVYGLDDRILVSGTGPSLMALAPVLGLPGMLAGNGAFTHPRNELSSAE